MSLSELKDLRQTNFVMGGNSNKDDLSVYYRDYRPWEIQANDQKALLLKFQKTNLSIGTETGTNHWVTTNNKDFVKHGHSEQPRLNEERKKELRSHQYDFGRHVMTLGNWTGAKMSEFKDEYTKKHVDVDTKNSEQLKNKLRKHNFTITDPSYKLANTVYETTYTPHPKETLNMPNSEELKKKVIELRNTNLVLGQDKPYNTTTMQADYQKITNFEPSRLDRAKLQKTHFELGNDPRQLTSINRTYFKAHKYDPANSVEAEKRELMEDLRSS